ncbi:hypothetical protein [Parasitella parasitica]|uniref:Uncharacterized protein n=1 Tax=Parasitella parasitica TaxID=35722 RepID=A0A0B7MWJ9_9FUNG|nr:hypothetical protein [Parasitella parasitica]
MSETSSNRMDSFQIARSPNSVPTARDDRGSMNCVYPRCFAWMWIRMDSFQIARSPNSVPTARDDEVP